MELSSSARPRHLHIGHHFFGAGNVGDDLMLAGFLAAASDSGRRMRLTCASAFDAASQERRFPQVQWLAYEDSARRDAIQSCDAWVGVGDTPFQIVVGPWFLDHLVRELELCRTYRKPMFFLGVGVNEPAALADPRARAVVDYASHIWARDERSAELLSDAGAAGKVSAAADLAHIWLGRQAWPAIEDDVLAYALNFEDSRQFDPQALTDMLFGRDGFQHRWLVQEVRRLAGSELDMIDRLPQDCRQRLDVRFPPYADGTLDALIACWGSPRWLVSSRYHAAVVGAWAGARVVSIARGEKVRGLTQQIQFATLPAFNDAAAIRNCIDRARPMDSGLLNHLSTTASDACRQLFERIDSSDRNPFFFVSGKEGEPPGDLRPANYSRSRVELASVEAMNSPAFQAFMDTINSFAALLDLRQFTDWSKIWEYPWLWHAGLSRVEWAGKHVIDLGSEISPMPWYLATRGAKVTLIETDPQWVERWEKLRAKLRVDATWQIVNSERIGLPSGTADIVTSFSVIEHQPDKRAAIAEVARVLKPGGLLAISFDVCELQMGMTFPQWNGCALTLKEFEDLIWLCPAFGNTARPRWNLDAIEPFLAWHRTTAPHHNYVAGAAMLYKE